MKLLQALLFLALAPVVYPLALAPYLYFSSRYFVRVRGLRELEGFRSGCTIYGCAKRPPVRA